MLLTHLRAGSTAGPTWMLRTTSTRMAGRSETFRLRGSSAKVDGNADESQTVLIQGFSELSLKNLKYCSFDLEEYKTSYNYPVGLQGILLQQSVFMWFSN